MSTATLPTTTTSLSEAIDRVLQGTGTPHEQEDVTALGAAILNYPSTWPLERRVRKIAADRHLRGFGELHGAALALRAIATARETASALHGDRRIANCPLGDIVERTSGALDAIVTDPDGHHLSSEGARRALGLVDVPPSASRSWAGGRRMGIALSAAEAIGTTLGIPTWRLTAMSAEYLAAWTPRKTAIDLVTAHGWAASASRPERPTRQACSLALRGLGVDRFEEEQTINWVRRGLGLHDFEFEIKDLSLVRRRLARWLAFTDGEIPPALRRRQLGATVRLARTRHGDLLGRRLVCGWQVSLQPAAVGSARLVVEQLAANETRDAAQAIADDFARDA